MSGLKDTLKGGWHPKVKPESWRGDFKGINQVAGWVGKGKDTSSTSAANEHISRPIAALKDPSLFGPPPKNVNYHGGAALPNQITPDTTGLGAPLSSAEIQANNLAVEEKAREEEEAKRKAAAPPVPFRADTTGLSTAILPPPPVRKDEANGRSPAISSRPKPSLPPRLPPRKDSKTGSSPTAPPYSDSTITEPPAHKGILNQGSLTRLGAAGISVPGFGIGEKQPISESESRTADSGSTKTGLSPNPSQLGALQSRFSRLATAKPSSEAPAQGTSLAQKQAALRTASAFRNDPSSVSLADARNAASTANDFHERHGDQMAAGWKSANSLNQKYGLTEKVNKYSSGTSPTQEHPTRPVQDVNETVAQKKAPPPPPKKKPQLSQGLENGAMPPPVPLASKPKPKPLVPSPETSDYDLDLQSLWFVKSPVVFPPPSINRLPGSRSHAYGTGWSSDGARKIHTFTGALRDNYSLVTTKIHLTWDANAPGLTAKAEQRHIPPPRPLSQRELESCREKYSERVATWCEARIGEKVGNGECWTLAADALSSVANECRAKNQEPCLRSQGYIHGGLIFSFLPPKQADPPGGVFLAGVARGDIIQFYKAHLKKKNGTAWSYAGDPDHTAVITHVDRGDILSTVEQNVGGVKKVMRGKYDLSETVSGEVRVFRAVGEKWLPPLDAKWP